MILSNLAPTRKSFTPDLQAWWATARAILALLAVQDKAGSPSVFGLSRAATYCIVVYKHVPKHAQQLTCLPTYTYTYTHTYVSQLMQLRTTSVIMRRSSQSQSSWSWTMPRVSRRFSLRGLMEVDLPLSGGRWQVRRDPTSKDWEVYDEKDRAKSVKTLIGLKQARKRPDCFGNFRVEWASCC